MAKLKVSSNPLKSCATQQSQSPWESLDRPIRGKSPAKSRALAAGNAAPAGESRRGDAQPALTVAAQTTAAAGPAQSSNTKATTLVITQRFKELVGLAREQGYLTYSDITDALADDLIGPEELDEIYAKLRNLDVEIVDHAEVDRIKQPEPDEEGDKARLDILDDPVRDRCLTIAGEGEV